MPWGATLHHWALAGLRILLPWVTREAWALQVPGGRLAWLRWTGSRPANHDSVSSSSSSSSSSSDSEEAEEEETVALRNQQGPGGYGNHSGFCLGLLPSAFCISLGLAHLTFMLLVLCLASKGLAHESWEQGTGWGEVWEIGRVQGAQHCLSLDCCP